MPPDPARPDTFTIDPVGPFSLSAAQDFAGGFAAGIGAHGTATGLLMTFPVEGWRDSAAVDVWQTPDGTIHGEVARLGRSSRRVRRQAARSLSLDHDGRGWAEVGERDPVIGALQAQLRLAPSGLLLLGVRGGHLVRHRPADRRCARHASSRTASPRRIGDAIEIGGQVVRPFPRPQRLLEVADRCRASAQVKVGRLHDLARAALDGVLDTERLRALPEAEALAELQALPGVGPWTASGDPAARLRRRRCASRWSTRSAGPPSAPLYGLDGAARRRDLDARSPTPGARTGCGRPSCSTWPGAAQQPGTPSYRQRG